MEYYQKASDAGLPAATHALAQLWWTGFYNESGRFVRDVEQAKECYEQAAEAGFPGILLFFSRIPVIIDGVVADEMTLLLCGVNMRARSYRMEAQRKSTIFLNGVSPHL